MLPSAVSSSRTVLGVPVPVYGTSSYPGRTLTPWVLTDNAQLHDHACKAWSFVSKGAAGGGGGGGFQAHIYARLEHRRPQSLTSCTRHLTGLCTWFLRGQGCPRAVDSTGAARGKSTVPPLALRLRGKYQLLWRLQCFAVDLRRAGWATFRGRIKAWDHEFGGLTGMGEQSEGNRPYHPLGERRTSRRPQSHH